MAEFSFLSDSSDEGAVDDLLRQAMDLSVLEQVAAINCSSFNPDSVLPTHLETRFSRLKSFPAAKSNKTTPSLSDDNKSASQSFNSHFHPAKSLKPDHPVPDEDDEALGNGLEKEFGTGSGSSSAKSSAQNPNSSIAKENPDEKIRPKSKSRSVEGEAEPDPDDDEALFSDKGLKKKKLGSGSGSSSFKLSKRKTQNGKSRQKSKSRSGYISSPSISSNSVSRSPSPSPPATKGCFWCSPKKVPRAKSKKNPDFSVDEAELLSELGIFSEKEQQKILKKAMREEEKINREAEKIVKWAKQASARINVSDVEDELSDSDYPK